jgi:hypothetical protein
VHPTIEIEVWKPVVIDGVRYPDYQVSSEGRIKNIVTGRILRPQFITSKFSSKRYYHVGLRRPGNERGPDGKFRRHSISVHRVVQEAFLGPCPEGLETEHLDGNKANNAFSNLLRMDHSENVKRAYDSGLIKQAGSNRRYTDQQIAEMHRMKRDGYTNYEIRDHFGCHESYVGIPAKPNAHSGRNPNGIPE